MEPKYEIGDFVRLDYGIIGEITSIPSEGCYFVNGYMLCTEAHFKEKVDKKTAFLTELKALLEKYGVEIDINSTNGDEEEGIIFLFGKEYISYTSRPFNPNKLKEFIFPITPSNIFDYDK